MLAVHVKYHERLNPHEEVVDVDEVLLIVPVERVVVALLLVVVTLLEVVWLVVTWVDDTVDVLLVVAVTGGREPVGEP